MIEQSIHLHAALDSLVEDGVGLLHTIEETEHEKLVIKSGMKMRRRSRRRR
jgi:hypothetical protein